MLTRFAGALARLTFETFEARTLLALFDIPVLVDGSATYYPQLDQWGSLEGGATASPRQYDTSDGPADERGILEFDVSGLPADTQLRSARLVFEVSVMVPPPTPQTTDFPNLDFTAFVGDGHVFPLDYEEPAQFAGEVEVQNFGLHQVPLDVDVIETYLGATLGIRAENPDPTGPWLAIALRFHPDQSLVRPHLLLDTDDGPELSLTVDRTTVREGDGPAAATGTLTRTGDLSQPLVVLLTSSDTSELTVPPYVTFGADQGEVTFPIAAVDDSIHDGTQSATITALSAIQDGPEVGLDTSFGQNGLAPTRLQMLIQGPYAAMAVQPDGKIVAAGENGGGASWRVTRFNADGTLDATFGTSGFTDTTFWAAQPTPFKVLIQPDGKILVGGKLHATGTAALARYNADGTRDTSFGMPGSGIADLANVRGGVEDIALRTGGMTLAISNTDSTKFRIVNLLANGGFPVTGGFLIDFPTLTGLARQIEFLPNGKFLLAGSQRVTRFNPGFTIDSTFGSGGSVAMSWDSFGSEITEMAVDSLGRIVLAGQQFVTGTGNSLNWAVARLNPEGPLDLSFGADGKRLIDFAAKNDLANTLALQPDGKILLGGFATMADNTLQSALARLNDNGSLDLTFDDDGRLTQNLLPTTAERIFDMALTPTGKLVALTGFGNDYRLARFDIGQDVINLLASEAMQVQDNDNFAPFVANQEFGIDENSPPGTVVGTVAASDADGDPLTFEIVGGNDADKFVISPSGQISVAEGAVLDFESGYNLSLVVRATDNGTPPLSAEGNIGIYLQNVNEPPVLDDAAFSVAENSAAGTIVGTLSVTDPEFFQQHSYVILSGNTGGAFTINDQGQVLVANPAALDFEVADPFVLDVRVSDLGAPPLFDDATVSISLVGVNDAPVVDDASLNVAENSAAGTVVGGVVASDEDAGQQLSFSIESGNASGAFAIDSSTGEITIANSAPLNHEANPTFVLTVRATDDGSPVLSSDATVTIQVTDVNESPSVAGDAFTIDENSSNGTAVGSVTASDPDAGQTLSYAIVAGNAGVAFAIDGAGNIAVANGAALNYETTPVFVLTIRATDSGTPALFAEGTITVNLANVNEAPVLNDASFTVAENSAVGTTVGTLVSSDPDVGQGKVFAIIAGNSGGAFAVDSTGKITVANAAALNYETTPTFNLTVRVTDSGSPTLSDTATVTVNLADVAESLQIGLDFKPGDSTNLVNLRRDSKLNMALLSSATFDARNVNLETLRMGRTGTEDSIVRVKGGRIQFSITDVNGDGRLDVVVTVDIARSGLQVGDTKIHMTGQTNSGQPIFGLDDVTVKAK